jgi:hypothetical protein
VLFALPSHSGTDLLYRFVWIRSLHLFKFYFEKKRRKTRERERERERERQRERERETKLGLRDRVYKVCED